MKISYPMILSLSWFVFQSLRSLKYPLQSFGHTTNFDGAIYAKFAVALESYNTSLAVHFFHIIRTPGFAGSARSVKAT
jgi:hypothetical protein